MPFGERCNHLDLSLFDVLSTTYQNLLHPATWQHFPWISYAWSRSEDP
jgi:hypothetical protein